MIVVNINPPMTPHHCGRAFFSSGTPMADGAAIKSIARVRLHGKLVGYLYTTVTGGRWYSTTVYPTRVQRIGRLPRGFTALPCVEAGRAPNKQKP